MLVVTIPSAIRDRQTGFNGLRESGRPIPFGSNACSIPKSSHSDRICRCSFAVSRLEVSKTAAVHATFIQQNPLLYAGRLHLATASLLAAHLTGCHKCPEISHPPLQKRLAGVFGDDFSDGVAESYDFVPVGLRGGAVAGSIYRVFVGFYQRAEFHFDVAEFW